MRNRGYQTEVIRQVAGLFAMNQRRVLVQMPTGAGKTIVAVQLVDRAAFRRTLYVVPTEEIFWQTSEKLDKLGIRHSHLLSGTFPDLTDTQVLLAMSPTLNMRRDTAMWGGWKPDLLFIDEMHRLYDQHAKLLKRFPNASVIGMTATPVRLDGKELHHLCPALVIGPSIKDLQNQGFLVPCRTYVEEVPDLSHVKINRREFDRDQVEQAYLGSGVLQIVPKRWKSLASGRRTITFCTGIETSQRLVAAYEAEGVRALHVDGGTPKDEREEALQLLRDHKIDVLSNVGLFIEGLDLVEVECVTLCRPTQSLAYHMQSIGRGLRISPHSGKKDLLVIDHSGNTVRHGLVEADRDWRSEGRALPQQLKRCRACGVVKVGPRCLHCGWQDKERRVNKTWKVRNEKRRSLRTPPRPCPEWARDALSLWLRVERQRSAQGLPLPDADLGREGFTESVVRRSLRSGR